MPFSRLWVVSTALVLNAKSKQHFGPQQSERKGCRARSLRFSNGQTAPWRGQAPPDGLPRWVNASGTTMASFKPAALRPQLPCKFMTTQTTRSTHSTQFPYSWGALTLIISGNQADSLLKAAIAVFFFSRTMNTSEHSLVTFRREKTIRKRPLPPAGGPRIQVSNHQERYRTRFCTLKDGFSPNPTNPLQEFL